jgi:hypothetical protein
MNTFKAKIITTAIAGLLGLTLMTDVAEANILLARQNGALLTGAVATNLDLSGSLAGVQATQSFNTTVQNQLVRVIFNAEGAIAGGPGVFLDDTIFIDNIACAPSGNSTNNAFVSGNGTTFIDGWVSAVTQCFYVVPTIGVHSIRVQVTPIPSGNIWDIRAMSLVIDSQ